MVANPQDCLSIVKRDNPVGIIKIQTLAGDKIPISALIVPRIAPPLELSTHITQEYPTPEGTPLGPPSNRK